MVDIILFVIKTMSYCLYNSRKIASIYMGLVNYPSVNVPLVCRTLLNFYNANNLVICFVERNTSTIHKYMTELSDK